MTERQECERYSRMDRNNLKVPDQQEVVRRVSLSPQQPSRTLTSVIQRRSSATATVFKYEGTQLETFQSLTFQPEQFGTLQDFRSGSCTPQTPQAEVHRQEQTPRVPQPETPPFQVKQIIEEVSQLQERTSRQKSHLEEKENSQSSETECRINQSLSEPTPEKRVRHQEVGETDEVKGQFDFTAPHRKMSVSSYGATSEDLWEQTQQQNNNTHVLTPKHPSSTAYESNSVQHLNISPPVRDNRVSPRAGRNQEVIVSFKTGNDHMERVSSSDMETLSTGCDETTTHFHLCQCSESRPGSSTGSNWVKGHKQATTTAAPSYTSQVPTPLKRSTFPTHSNTRSSAAGGGGGSEDEDNPPSQCHQFPKLPSPPPGLGLQDSHLNLSEDDCASEADTEGWMFSRIQKQEQSLGSGLELQQQSSYSSCCNRDDETLGDSNGNLNIYSKYI